MKTRWIAPALALACMLLLPVSVEAKGAPAYCTQLHLDAGSKGRTVCRKGAAPQRQGFRHRRGRLHRQPVRAERPVLQPYAAEYEGRAVVAVVADLPSPRLARAAAEKSVRLGAAASRVRAERLVSGVPLPRPRPAIESEGHPLGALVAPITAGANMLRAYVESLVRPAARCFEFERTDPRVKQVVADAARHFRGTAVMTSCFRSVAYNRRVGGVRQSQHIAHRAIDFRIAGVSPIALARYARSHPLMRRVGGVGRYAGRDFIHVDSGPRRNWCWGCGAGPARYAVRRHRVARL